MLAAREEVNDCYDDESYDSEDSLDTSLSDDFDTCFVDGHDAIMDDAYEDELAIVPDVKHEIVAVAPTLDCPIILLKSPTIPENFALIKAQCDGLHLSYHPKNRVENNTRVLVGHEQHDLCDSYCQGNGTRVGSSRRKESFKARPEPIGLQLGRARQSYGRLLPSNRPY